MVLGDAVVFLDERDVTGGSLIPTTPACSPTSHGLAKTGKMPMAVVWSVEVGLSQQEEGPWSKRSRE